MREILFRGKRVDNGKWVEGFLSKTRQNWKRAEGTAKKMVPDGEKFKTNELKLCIDYEDRGIMCCSVIDPETVGQYTGLTDKNGRKIFEGDIVVIIDAYDNKVTYIVEYKLTAFCVSQLGVNYSTYLGDFNSGKYEIEIIGNIHDNPELLKGESDNESERQIS